MLGVGQKFPDFSLTATISTEMDSAFTTISNDSYKDKWLVLFFWPKDFTFVCPTEITAFAEKNETFEKQGAKLLGGSIDSEFVHLAWRQHNRSLNDIPFPMLADIKRELCKALGILDPEEGVAQRATFIVDPEGFIRFASVTDLNVGRNVDEVLRVLEALRNGGLCPCNWHPGQKTIEV
ncbi:MAG TPA: alkyl hydroperoxide reductase [Rhodospirillaceae bacterium]|nr:alkyl hydroperoxide reductase [Rhodospirillaceae bacterium]